MTATINGDQNGTVGLINTMTAKATTSGTAIDFTGIPAGVKRITVLFNGVSTNGTSNLQIQIGSGSVAVSGYVSNAFGATSAALQGNVSSTTGFVAMSANAAAATWSGVVTLVLLNTSSNIWTVFGAVGRGDSAVGFTNSGSVTLSGTLDRLRLTTVNGTDTFDAGSANILWE